MLRRLLAAAFVPSLVSFVSLVACASKPEPATPSLSDPAGAAVGPVPASSEAREGEAAPAAASEPAPRPRKPFPIHNSCSEVVTVVFGENPKTSAAGTRTVASNSSIDGPRDAEGKQTVWLLDAKGEPLVSVHVTRGMKQLEIGRSCRTLDAR
jgi:hypothetical protein